MRVPKEIQRRRRNCTKAVSFSKRLFGFQLSHFLLTQSQTRRLAVTRDACPYRCAGNLYAPNRDGFIHRSSERIKVYQTVPHGARVFFGNGAKVEMLPMANSNFQ